MSLTTSVGVNETRIAEKLPSRTPKRHPHIMRRRNDLLTQPSTERGRLAALQLLSSGQSTRLAQYVRIHEASQDNAATQLGL
jgi:hypothetical protein